MHDIKTLSVSVAWICYGSLYFLFTLVHMPVGDTMTNLLLASCVMLGSMGLIRSINPISTVVSKRCLAYGFLFVCAMALAKVFSISPEQRLSLPSWVLHISIIMMASFLSYILLAVADGPFAFYGPVDEILSRQSGFLSALSCESSFRTPLLASDPGESCVLPDLRYPTLVTSLRELSAIEIAAVESLRQSLRGIPQTGEWGLHDWLKLAWARQLVHGDSAGVLHSHLDYIHRFELLSISWETIESNFQAGFSCLAGRDTCGRPMLWQRMKFMTPSTIPLRVGIKSTWLALDAALADSESNRLGVCLVYDFRGIGMSNITLNFLDIRHGALACGLAHPSHVSRVLFMDAPLVFRVAFAAATPLLPKAVVSVIEFIDSSRGLSRICSVSDLPRYLRESSESSFDVPEYIQWLLTRLNGQRLLYADGI